MEKKIQMVNRYQVITPVSVMEILKSRFPEIEEHFEIKKGILSYMVNTEPNYLFAFVFELVSKYGADKQQMLYYPVTEEYVRETNPLPFFPIKSDVSGYPTPKGRIHFCECNGEMSVTITPVYGPSIEGKH